MYIQLVAFYPLSKPFYTILMLCCSSIMIGQLSSSFQIRFFSFWINFLNPSRVPNFLSPVPMFWEQVSIVTERVPNFLERVTNFLERVPELLERVPKVLSRVPESWEHVTEVKIDSKSIRNNFKLMYLVFSSITKFNNG